MASFTFKLIERTEGQSRYSVKFDRLGRNLPRVSTTTGADQLKVGRGRRGFFPTGRSSRRFGR